MRKVADCRDYPSEKNCTLTISGEEDEVLAAAFDHAVKAHGYKASPELREELREMLRNEEETRGAGAPAESVGPPMH